MIGNLPLWLVLYIWYLQRHHAPTMILLDYPKLFQQIEDLRNSIPVPSGWMETYLTKKTLEWLDTEKENLYMLRAVGAFQIGIIGK